jgi:hypothetical protein
MVVFWNDDGGGSGENIKPPLLPWNVEAVTAVILSIRYPIDQPSVTTKVYFILNYTQHNGVRSRIHQTFPAPQDWKVHAEAQR